MIELPLYILLTKNKKSAEFNRQYSIVQSRSSFYSDNSHIYFKTHLDFKLQSIGRPRAYNGGFCGKKNKVKEELAHVYYNRKPIEIGMKVCITNDAEKKHTYALKMPSLLQSPTENTVPKTLSHSILSEEICTDCFICCNPLNGDEMACEKCEGVSHCYCMSPDKSDMCPACAATKLSNSQDISQYNDSSDVSRNQNTQNRPLISLTVTYCYINYYLPKSMAKCMTLSKVYI